MGTPIGGPTGLSQCYGRTDGRTKTVQPIAIKAEAVTHARVSEDPARLSELLDPAALWPTERHPVIRSGERAEIPPHVRAAVWFRDRGKCELCGTRNCYANDDWPWQYDNGYPTCHVHGVDVTHPSAWRCPVVRGYKAAWQRDRTLPDWHRIQPLEGGSIVAYCAHCNAPGLTSRPL